MRLFHALVALVATSTALVIAAPLQAPHATINDSEVLVVNKDLKPLEKSLPATKHRPRSRFRSLTERHLRKRADEKKKEPKRKKSKSKNSRPSDPTEGGDDMSSGRVDEAEKTKPVDGVAPNRARPINKEDQHHRDGENDGGNGGDNDGDNDGDGAEEHKSKKMAKTPKKKAPKHRRPKNKGGSHKGGDDSGTGSDDDPDTDNASENEHGTDDDD